MKVLFSLFAIAAIVATINATCLHCDNNQKDHQVIKYEDLRYLDNFNKNTQNEFANDAKKYKIIQTLVQKYPLYTKEAKQTPKFSDPLNVIDTTEFLANGEIEYKNVLLHGLEKSVLKELNFDEIDENSISIHVSLDKAEIAGQYVAATPEKKDVGQFFIALKNVQLKAKFPLNSFLEILPEIDAECITFERHESTYTEEEVLKELESQNAGIPKPYAFYYVYLNNVIKNRLANEMTVSFMPLISKRLESMLSTSVLFPTNKIAVPKSYAVVAPGIQAEVSDILLRDLWNTNTIQKLINYTIIDQDLTEMLFCFSTFDFEGTNKWALKFNTGNVFNGKATFAVDNMQTIIVATKSNKQKKLTIKFIKTTLNGLTVMLNTDDNCESIRDFAHQRIPEVLEKSIKTFIDEQSEMVLKTQMTLIGKKYQQ